MERTILHCDMNNFYASVETVLDPSLKGKEIAVCGAKSKRRGVVLAKSTQAKSKGVITGEPIWQALKKCPNLLIVAPHYDQYKKYSRAAKKIYYEYTNQVESFGIDECFLDCTASKNLFGDGVNIGNELRLRMKEELGLTISVGVSFNKIFAKLGSDMKKPDALTHIPKENYKAIIWPLKVESMMGIGKKTKIILNKNGIFTIGDLANANIDILKKTLGINGELIYQYANGKDDSKVSDMTSHSPAKSIGHGMTASRDLTNNEEVKRIFTELSFDVSKRLRKEGLQACGIQIAVKDNKLRTKQYQMPTNFPTFSSVELRDLAVYLFENNYTWKNKVRALTIRAINLVESGIPYQLDLFDNHKKHEKLEKADKMLFQIRSKYGDEAITLLNQLDED